MAWVPVIERIVSQDSLDATLTSYLRITDANSLFNSKINATDGTASNLMLTSVGTDPRSAVSRSVLSEQVNSLSTSISGKINISGGTFTGPVSVPAPTGNANPVTLEFFNQNAVSRSGGALTGVLSYNESVVPSASSHLVNKLWVDAQLLNKADLVWTTDQLSLKVSSAQLSTYAPLNSPSFTGSPQILTAISPAEDSAVIATTAWTRGLIASGYGAGARSISINDFNTVSPVFKNPTDESSSPAATVDYVSKRLEDIFGPEIHTGHGKLRSNPASDDYSTSIATTQWVRDEILAVLAGKAKV